MSDHRLRENFFRITDIALSPTAMYALAMASIFALFVYGVVNIGENDFEERPPPTDAEMVAHLEANRAGMQAIANKILSLRLEDYLHIDGELRPDHPYHRIFDEPGELKATMRRLGLREISSIYLKIECVSFQFEPTTDWLYQLHMKSFEFCVGPPPDHWVLVGDTDKYYLGLNSWASERHPAAVRRLEDGWYIFHSAQDSDWP